MIPRLSRVAVLLNPRGSVSTLNWKEIQLPARTAGSTAAIIGGRERQRFRQSIRGRNRGARWRYVRVAKSVFTANLRRIADLAARSRLPSTYHWSEFADAGGLVTYGPDRADLFRRAATYVDKILKGAKPGDLPIEQPTKFELVINMKTAKALGLTSPAVGPGARGQGDRVTTRREFLIAGTAGLFLRGVPESFAQQQGKVWRIGFLSGNPRPPSFESHAYGDFLRGLRDLGYVEGKHFAMEWRFADGKLERLPGLASELVKAKVDVVVAVSSLSVEAARKATTSIPIVMTGVGNPVGSGFVASLSRPGGNITGLSNVSIDVSSKYLEVLHTAVPKVTRVAVLVNPAHPNHPTSLKNIQAAAKTFGVKVVPLDATTPDQVEAAFSVMQRERVDGLIVPPDPFFGGHGKRITELAAQYRLPAFYGGGTLVEQGGLIGYGPNTSDTYRRAAALVDKILKGAKPADIPVELPTRFDLVVNLRTAKALGITIPQELLLRADKVIE